MIASTNLPSLLSSQGMTTAEALALYDSLEPVDLAFLVGRWRGKGIPSQHPMDGMLEMSHWYGKAFIDPESVHPLLFEDAQGDIFQLKPDPTLMRLALHFSIARYPWLAPGLNWFMRWFKTDVSQARLRMLESRGVVTATMIYDYLPINDSFKKIDENSVLGLMDYKVISQPFFFVLQRDIPL
ncbi:MAG: DUF4334 domain-containing protein [Synechocystis sp.]